MTIPLSPEINLSPSSFSASGQTIVASVTLPNRPAFTGIPITGLTTITPRIVCSRVPTGVMPFHIQVSAGYTTCNAGDAYMELDYRWDFGDPTGAEWMTDRISGKTVNLNTSQVGPEAAYMYRTPGTYTITLTVTGKDENGNVVTATTTTMKTLEQHYVARGQRWNPSYTGTKLGGTFTLTVNGETTATLAATATNDEVYDALLLLPSLDATNMRVTYMGNIEFFGNLAGTSNTVSIDYSNLTDVAAGMTPQVFVDLLGVTASAVTVNDFTGLTVQYFDSTAAGGGDGTIGSPKNQSSDLKSFVFGGSNRVAYVKRGSTFTFGQYGEYGDSVAGGAKRVRVLSYGTGAKPILADSEFGFQLGSGVSGYARAEHNDLVLSDLNIQQTTFGNWIWGYAGPNGTPGYYYSSIQDIVLDGLEYEQMTATEEGSATFCSMQKANTPNGDNGRLYNYLGINIKGFHFWNCEADMGGKGGFTTLLTMDSWFSMVGGGLSGGQGSLTHVHHIYPNILMHSLYRYIEFGPGFDNANDKGRGFCINGNVHGNSLYSNYHLIDGCNITGTMNGIDLSNEANADYRPYGQFSDVIIQFNKLSPGKTGGQSNAIYGGLCRRLCTRFNDFFNDILTSGYNVHSENHWIYKNRFYNSDVSLRGANIDFLYMHDNIMHYDLAGGSVNCCLILWDADVAATSKTSIWDSDGNIFYAPNQSGIIYDGVSTRISLATWQAAPYTNDANGSNVNPGWYNPEIGQFIEGPVVRVDWPTGFTDHEYSVDDGGTWLAYTDNSDLSFATYLSDYDTVLFRAKTNSSTSNQTISGASDVDSVDTASEAYSATLIYGASTVFTGDTSGSGTENGGAITGDLNVSDTDGIAAPNFRVTSPANNGTATINSSSGAWSYTPDADWFGSDSFTVTVTDDNDNDSTQIISITVTQAGDSPTIFGGDTSGTCDENADYVTGILSASDAVDGMTTPNFTVTVAATHGEASINSTSGAWSYTPDADYFGSDSFTVRVTDDLGNHATQVITITVNEVLSGTPTYYMISSGGLIFTIQTGN